MDQQYQKKKQIIYFDYTAGRGSYDDEYQEDCLSDQNKPYCNEIKNEDISAVINKNHCVFENFLEIKPYRLNQQNLNKIQHQRRNSYNKSPLKERTARQIYQQHTEDTENIFHYANERFQNKPTEYQPTKISNSNSHQFSEKIRTVNWEPKKI